MFDITLPSGKEVSFRAPKFEDRRKILRQYDRNDGYMPEDLLAAKCLVKIDSVLVDQEEWSTSDPISNFTGWDLREQAYYMEVFMTMFGLDDTGKQAAQEAAKKLMSGTSNSPTTGKNKAVKAPSGSLTD